MQAVFKKIKNVAGVIVMIVIAALIIIAVVTSIINSSKNKPTFIFNHAFLWVETGSMEPSIPSESYVLVERYDDDELVKGDVITFVCNDKTSPVYGSLITHRIVEVTSGGYKTKGDASAIDSWTVKKEDVVAVYVKNLSVFTAAGRIFASPIGLILIIALFIGSCAFLYVPDIINALKDEKAVDLEKEKEIERRVAEEVLKMKERDKSEDKE